jgi:hypothetical protein
LGPMQHMPCASSEISIRSSKGNSEEVAYARAGQFVLGRRCGGRWRHWPGGCWRRRLDEAAAPPARPRVLV